MSNDNGSVVSAHPTVFTIETDVIHKPVGKASKDADGKAVRQYVDVSLSFPKIHPRAVSETFDLATAMEKILEAKLPGFASLNVLVDYINFGFRNGAAAAIRRGQDLRRSPSEVETIKLYAKLVAIGSMTLEDTANIPGVLTLCEKQGIQDVEEELRALVAAGV